MTDLSLPEIIAIVSRLRAAGSVFAEEEAKLLIASAKSLDELEHFIDQRIVGLPVEQIIGWADFLGTRIELDPGVFVPRRRSEFLVNQAIMFGRQTPRPVVVDLGCGSGALGVIVAMELGEVDLYATDIDPAATNCARRNVARVGGRVYQGNLFDPLPPELRGHVDILLANMPYVPSAAVDTLPAEARLYEPRIALDGGEDGLDFQRLVAAAAPAWLAPGGRLLVETSEGQLSQTIAIFAKNNLNPIVSKSDELNAIVVIGQIPDGGGEV